MTEQSSTSPCAGCSEHGAEHGRNGLTGAAAAGTCVGLAGVAAGLPGWAFPAPRLFRDIRNR